MMSSADIPERIRVWISFGAIFRSDSGIGIVCWSFDHERFVDRDAKSHTLVGGDD